MRYERVRSASAGTGGHSSSRFGTSPTEEDQRGAPTSRGASRAYPHATYPSTAESQRGLSSVRGVRQACETAPRLFSGVCNRRLGASARSGARLVPTVPAVARPPPHRADRDRGRRRRGDGRAGEGRSRARVDDRAVPAREPDLVSGGSGARRGEAVRPLIGADRQVNRPLGLLNVQRRVVDTCKGWGRRQRCGAVTRRRSTKERGRI